MRKKKKSPLFLDTKQLLNPHPHPSTNRSASSRFLLPPSRKSKPNLQNKPNLRLLLPVFEIRIPWTNSRKLRAIEIERSKKRDTMQSAENRTHAETLISETLIFGFLQRSSNDVLRD